MSKKIFIAGSLAFDIIFSIPEDFKKSIPLQNGKLKKFNASYTANNKREYPGGTAGNIAYWLGKNKIKSVILSAWGRDLYQKKYGRKLENIGAELKGFEGEYSANAYIISDPLHQQLTIWQPNCYNEINNIKITDYIQKSDLQNFEHAIFSAGTPDSIKKHLEEFRQVNKKAKIIFDPGQVSQFFSQKNFLKCIEIADIIIGNEIEWNYFENFLKNLKINPFQKDKILITTLGENGVNIYNKKEEIHLEALKVKKIAETTGAGDAFRAGLLTGLNQNLTIQEAAKIGIKLGAECVMLNSGQE